MYVNFSEERYQEMLQKLFVRFPSFQKAGAGAYKPGTANMEFADALLGHPHRNYRIIHVAGTNGKGSVSHIIASVLAASGYRTGLYTSPHILDFRERMRIVEAGSPQTSSEVSCRLIPKEDVWTFIQKWNDTFDHLDMSFFEITTLMALDWFSGQGVDYVVLETGLGGRLDSTNIVTPVLSVITNIGLDHCDLLGDTLPEIAFEKAGIIKPKVPVVIGESNPLTDPVFERKVLYTNLPEPEFMGSRSAVMSLLAFADKTEPYLWDRHQEILSGMDLQGAYQIRNLRTVLAAVQALAAVPGTFSGGPDGLPDESRIIPAILNAAACTGFRGRWEKLSDNPHTICDIGHNGHGLRYNFAQLERMLDSGECTDLVMVYGSVADKDVDAVMPLLPKRAVLVFTQASSKRALPAEQVKEIYLKYCLSASLEPGEVHVAASVSEAVELARRIALERTSADPASRPVIYIGGSTYVVSEAMQ